MLSCSRIALLSLLGVLTGCATWHKSEPSLRSPTPQLSMDAIACQIAFVQWEPHHVEQDEILWRATDEQILPPKVRRRLEENGLRVGLISGQLPAEIQRKLSATRDPVAALTGEKATAGDELLSRRERRQCRLGISEVVEVLPYRSQRTVVLMKDDDGRVRGMPFDQPRGFFTLTPYSQADGRLSLELVPGIDYGDPKQRVMGNPGLGILRLDMRRDQHLYSILTFNVPQTSDQTLVVTSTRDPKGIGATFFANRFESTSEQLLLLIRVARNQSGDLFLPSEQPLVTPLE